MTAQQQPQPTSGRWQPEPGLAGELPDDALLGWLTEPGLLTARLRQQCGDEFRLQLVNEAHSRAHATDLYRQVALCCGDVPCIYAESRIPLATANTHFWLRDLGDEPLGERLQQREDTKRGRFSYARVERERLPMWIQAYVQDAKDGLWARRSDFLIGDEQLAVTEIFLPGVVNCGAAGGA